MVDADRLRHSWDLATQRGGDQLALRFYGYLFIAHPETRPLFGLSMAAQRDRLVNALGYTVAHVDQLDALTPFLQQLGRDHRKFGVAAEHYGPVGQALLATLAEAHDDSWSAELADDWAAAFGVVAKVMTDAADNAEAEGRPPWWHAEVVAHQRRSINLAVLTLRPATHYPYRPGQSLSLQTHLRPRVWRYYSPANAPRPDGTIDLHVRQQPGGPVSTALVSGLQPGDVVTLGPPVGDRLTLDSVGTGDLLLLAGGTGLAPLKALVEAAGIEQQGRQVTLIAGARTPDDLYDQDSLFALANKYDWLTVVPVVAQPGVPGQAATPIEAALTFRDWWYRDIVVCGSDAMVMDTVNELRTHGIAPERLHYEGFTGLGGDQFGVVGKDHQ